MARNRRNKRTIKEQQSLFPAAGDPVAALGWWCEKIRDGFPPVGAGENLKELTEHAQEEELKEKFAKYGQVATIKLKKDLFTGENKGYAFVTMPIQDEAKAAIKALTGKKLRGKEIKVTEARSHDHDWNKGKKKNRPF